MKQLGVIFIIMGIAVIFQTWFNLKGWVWDLLGIMGALTAMMFTPPFRQIAALRFIWRLALFLVSIVGFIALLTLVHTVSGLGLECSSSTSLMLIGLGLILFNQFNKRRVYK